MRLRIDPVICAGHGRCSALGPDVFVLNDDGYNDMGDIEIPAGLEEQAWAGFEACPERAISMVDESPAN